MTKYERKHFLNINKNKQYLLFLYILVDCPHYTDFYNYILNALLYAKHISLHEDVEIIS